MTWFRIDDKFWSHPKVLHLSSLSVGVWARIGSYCSDQLTDGQVEDRTVHSICPESRAVIDRAIAELVAAGLWEVAGPETWTYHDWVDQQPTREEVKASRAASAERQRRHRERKAAERAQVATVTPLARDRRSE